MAQFLHIKRKLHDYFPFLVDLEEDFDYVTGEYVAPTVILKDNISLYCIDDQNERVIFVESPLDVQLIDFPFYYYAQYQHAQRLIAVPYNELYQISSNMTELGEQLIMIYMVGRCGSTLLSNIFKRVDGVLSLSEPAFFVDIVRLAKEEKKYAPKVRKLLYSGTLSLCKPTSMIKPSWYVIKTHTFFTQCGRMMHQLFPQAKVIFLYRNAHDVLLSRASVSPAHLEQLAQALQDYTSYFEPLVPLLRNYANIINLADPQAVDYFTLVWLSSMQSYLELQQAGVSTYALRYEELMSDPERVVSSLFEYCCIPVHAASEACKALEQDSQQGTDLSRDHKHLLTPEQISRIRQRVDWLLQHHPQIQTADFIVPTPQTQLY